MDMMNRIQDEGGGGLSSMHRPSLPRLKNKASLGRLLVFGGVLDFDSAGGMNGEMLSTSIEPPLPTPSPVLAALYALPSSLSGSSPSTTAIMQQQQDKQQSIIRDSFSTPIKQSASSAALRALKALNHEHQYEQDRTLKYPASISLGRPAHIPRLDFDHASSAGQGGAHLRRRRAEEEEEGVESRSSFSSSHSHAPQSENLHSQPGHQSSSYTSFVGIYTGSNTRFNNNRAVSKELTGDYIPPTDINDAVVNVGDGGQPSNLGPAEEDEDDIKLVREIQQDMDNGGYSSLEQILAKNGFQVCRVATPPSTGRRISAHHSHFHHQHQPHSGEQARHISTSVEVSTSSTLPPPIASSSSNQQTAIIESAHLLPVTKDVLFSSTKSKKSSHQATDKPTTTSSELRTDNNRTMKNKTSLLSFSGFVSSLWGGNTLSSDNVASNAPAPIVQHHATQATSRPSRNISRARPGVQVQQEDIINDNGYDDDDGSPPPLYGPEEQERNEVIKGWLKQTVQATNNYMIEARKSVDAARYAMSGATAGGAEPPAKQLEEEAIAAIATTQSEGQDVMEGDTAEDDGDITLPAGQDRKQGTQSTLDSIELDTPTSSPTPKIHTTRSSARDGRSKTASHQEQSHTTAAPAPYSPPLKQAHQIPVPHLVDVTYFDSPVAARQRVKQQQQQQQREAQELKAEDNERYPPVSSTKLDSPHQANTTDEDEQDKPLSAESLLRGTLRHAVSEGTLRNATVKSQDEKKVPVKTSRPSIASIFGIPLSFSSSTSSSSSSVPFTDTVDSDICKATTAQHTTAEQQRRQEQHQQKHPKEVSNRPPANKLKESTTESLSTNAPSSTNTKSRSSSNYHTKESTSSSSANATAPKLLRKTASKHTLRKAASPVLSNIPATVSVLPDDEVETPTRVSSKTAAAQVDQTPVKAARSSSLRGPVPKSIASVSEAQPGDTANRAGARQQSTPRQIAHRNPRDSPIGETRVVRSPPLPGRSSSIVAAKRTSTNHPATPVKQPHKLPSILDDENDVSGLWSPPRPGTRNNKKMTNVLSEAGDIKNNANGGNSTTQDNRPRLKAKESLERILATKQMQAGQDVKKDGQQREAIPPVPPVPAIIREISTTVTVASSKRSTNGGTAAQSVVSTVPRKPQPNLKRQASFTGTIRGMVASAVSGWTDSSTSVIDATSSSVVSGTGGTRSRNTNNYNAAASTHSLRRTSSSQARNRQAQNLRKAKSMYVKSASLNNHRDNDGEMKNDAWMAERNSLILPTIIISDWTHHQAQ